MMTPLALLFAAAAAVSATPIGDPAQWITTEDYPATALRANEAGITVTRFDISEAGRIENCSASQSSGSTALDAAACAALVERGRFTPAKDNRGRPVRSSMTRRVRWAIPAEETVEIGRLIFTRGANGRIASCSVENAGRSVELVESFCDALTVRDPGTAPVQSGALTIPMPPVTEAAAAPSIGRLVFTRGGNGRISNCSAQGGGRTAMLETSFCEALAGVGTGPNAVQSGAMTIAMPDAR